MPRRGRAEIRQIEADPVYEDKLVAQFINLILKQGKKNIARDAMYEALEIVKQKSGTDGLTVLKKAAKNVRPMLEVKPRRVGGATYQVPVEVAKRRSNTLAVRWIVNFARGRRQKGFAQALAAEILDASNNTGSSIKKRQDLHKMAESNRAFAHYRW